MTLPGAPYQHQRLMAAIETQGLHLHRNPANDQWHVILGLKHGRLVKRAVCGTENCLVLRLKNVEKAP